MRSLRLAAVAVVALVLSACASAQGPWIAGRPAATYQQGYDIGWRAGDDDARRGRPFDYSDEIDYRRGGSDRWSRADQGAFREGFATGYRDGYEARIYTSTRPPVYRPPVYGNPGRGAGRGIRYDPAVEQGYADGYEAGLDDGEDGRPYEPVRERDYREADEGYDRSYGSREVYQANYRAGFRSGYEDGYRAARRW